MNSLYDDMMAQRHFEGGPQEQAAPRQEDTRASLFRHLKSGERSKVRRAPLREGARLDGRCGECENCKKLDRVKARVLAVTNVPRANSSGAVTYQGADDDVIQVWNDAVRDYPCTGLGESRIKESGPLREQVVPEVVKFRGEYYGWWEHTSAGGNDYIVDDPDSFDGVIHLPADECEIVTGDEAQAALKGLGYVEESKLKESGPLSTAPGTPWKGQRYKMYVQPTAAELFGLKFPGYDQAPASDMDFRVLPSGRTILVGTEDIYTRSETGPPPPEDVDLGGTHPFRVVWESRSNGGPRLQEGVFVIKRDGVEVDRVPASSPQDDGAVMSWFHRNHSYSMDHGLKYEGYSYEYLEEARSVRDELTFLRSNNLQEQMAAKLTEAAHALTITDQLLGISDDDELLRQADTATSYAPGWDNLLWIGPKLDTGIAGHSAGDLTSLIYTAIRERNASTLRQLLHDLKNRIEPVFSQFNTSEEVNAHFMAESKLREDWGESVVAPKRCPDGSCGELDTLENLGGDRYRCDTCGWQGVVGLVHLQVDWQQTSCGADPSVESSTQDWTEVTCLECREGYSHLDWPSVSESKLKEGYVESDLNEGMATKAVVLDYSYNEGGTGDAQILVLRDGDEVSWDAINRAEFGGYFTPGDRISDDMAVFAYIDRDNSLHMYESKLQEQDGPKCPQCGFLISSIGPYSQNCVNPQCGWFSESKLAEGYEANGRSYPYRIRVETGPMSNEEFDALEGDYVAADDSSFDGQTAVFYFLDRGDAQNSMRQLSVVDYLVHLDESKLQEGTFVFRATTADGQTFEGEIQGSGGRLHYSGENVEGAKADALRRLNYAKNQAGRGQDSGFYEPQPGHIGMYRGYDSNTPDVGVVPLVGTNFEIVGMNESKLKEGPNNDESGWSNEATRQLATFIGNDPNAYAAVASMPKPVSVEQLKAVVENTWEIYSQGFNYGEPPNWQEMVDTINNEGIFENRLKEQDLPLRRYEITFAVDGGPSRTWERFYRTPQTAEKEVERLMAEEFPGSWVDWSIQDHGVWDDSL